MNRNKNYKKYIYTLCVRTRSGDMIALAELQNECGKSTQAVWAVKHWQKVRRKRCSNGPRIHGSLGRTNYQSSRSRPLQGGAPGLGK